MSVKTAPYQESIAAAKVDDYPKFYLYSRVVRAKLFIDESYSDNIDLDNISDEACFSKYHFIRLFRSIYGTTPHQYLIRVRLEYAKKFLRENFSVSATCFKVGFDSVSSFTGLFKKAEGVTPSAYQRAYREREEHIRRQPLHFIPHCFAEHHGWLRNSNFQEVT
ncbi:MAG TPA: AraC family transcriptional regulator [Puia sp.]|nr:AraC family transcriptional regulator [Puia sp.]